MRGRAADAFSRPLFLLDKDFGFDILSNNAIGSSFQEFLFLGTSIVLYELNTLSFEAPF